MRKLSIFLLFSLFLFLVGCEDKTKNDTPIIMENTTELPQKNNPKTPLATMRTLFTLSNTKAEDKNVTFYNQGLTFENQQKPIVIMHFFATWCQPCIGEIAFLNTLQKKYQKNVLVAGILTHDTLSATKLNAFMHKHTINYFISNASKNDALATLVADSLSLPENFSIPLIVIYVNNRYFSHYEGIVLSEMVEYDIEQAYKQLKLRP